MGPGPDCVLAARHRIHEHWCGFCGALLHFGTACVALAGVPPCPRCGEYLWRDGGARQFVDGINFERCP